MPPKTPKPRTPRVTKEETLAQWRERCTTLQAQDLSPAKRKQVPPGLLSDFLRSACVEFISLRSEPDNQFYYMLINDIHNLAIMHSKSPVIWSILIDKINSKLQRRITDNSINQAKNEREKQFEINLLYLILLNVSDPIFNRMLDKIKQIYRVLAQVYQTKERHQADNNNTYVPTSQSLLGRNGYGGDDAGFEIYIKARLSHRHTEINQAYNQHIQTINQAELNTTELEPPSADNGPLISTSVSESLSVTIPPPSPAPKSSQNPDLTGARYQLWGGRDFPLLSKPPSPTSVTDPFNGAKKPYLPKGQSQSTLFAHPIYSTCNPNPNQQQPPYPEWGM